MISERSNMMSETLVGLYVLGRRKVINLSVKSAEAAHILPHTK